MQWWGALTNQFAQLATTAMKDSATDAAKTLAGNMLKQSFDNAAAGFKAAASAPVKAATAAGAAALGAAAGAGKAMARPKAAQEARAPPPRPSERDRLDRRALRADERAAPDAAVLAAAVPAAADRSRRQAEVVAALGAALPAHALLWQREDTVPYECDGLTAYRAAAAGRRAARDRGAGRRGAARLPSRSRCRWWRAAPAPGLSGGALPHALGVTLSLAKFNRILARSTRVARTATVQCGVRNLAISEAAAPLRPVLRARPVAARSPAPSAATSPRTRAACIA